MSPKYTRSLSRERPSFDKVRHTYAVAMRQEFEQAGDGVMADMGGTPRTPVHAQKVPCFKTAPICVPTCVTCATCTSKKGDKTASA